MNSHILSESNTLLVDKAFPLRSPQISLLDYKFKKLKPVANLKKQNLRLNEIIT